MSDPNYVAPPYPWHVYRCLHSRLADWLIGVPTDARDAVMAHLDGQMAFEHFVLAIHHYRRLRITSRVSEDAQDAWIGLAVPTDEGWHPLFELHHRVLGIEVDYILASNALQVENALDHILKVER